MQLVALCCFLWHTKAKAACNPNPNPNPPVDSSSPEVCERVKCPVCLEKPKAPHSSKCGHVCCYECWNKVLALKLECPVCRQQVRHKFLNKIYFSF
mmetsp:Transcript_33416/g.54216  ORF Transcript_33416/g.54216 Transcript_33416/m.54216 type:complete len:96 (+) Transcript_33416:2041-2328(+)